MNNNNFNNPINEHTINKIIEVYSRSNNGRSFQNNIMNYTKKNDKENNLKYRDELVNFLNFDIGFNINFFNELDSFINIRDNNDEKDLSIVLNTGYNSTMLLTKLFIEECIKEDNGLGFDIEFHANGKTDNSFIIHCTKDECMKYINILNNILNKNRSLCNDIYEPGLLFSRVNDIYGIYSCKNGINDFYDKRSRHLFCAIDTTYKDFILKNYNTSFNYCGREISIIDYLTNSVNREIFIDLTFDFLKDTEFFDRYGFNKDKTNNTDFITNSSEIKDKLIKRIMSDSSDNSFSIKAYYGENETIVTVNDELIDYAIRKCINEIVSNRDDLKDLIINNIGLMYSILGIYKDNYAFDTDDNYTNNKNQMKKML